MTFFYFYFFFIMTAFQIFYTLTVIFITILKKSFDAQEIEK